MDQSGYRGLGFFPQGIALLTGHYQKFMSSGYNRSPKRMARVVFREEGHIIGCDPKGQFSCKSSKGGILFFGKIDKSFQLPVAAYPVSDLPLPAVPKRIGYIRKETAPESSCFGGRFDLAAIIVSFGGRNRIEI
jgi:hypothetical protein